MSAIDVLRVDHVSYTVGDIDRSVAFYEKLGFECVNRYQESGPQTDLGAATDHADMDAAYAQLTADGVEFLSPPNVDQYGEKWVYMRDPDGIPAELMQPGPDSGRATHETPEENR